MRIHSHLTTQSHMFNSETGTKKQTESFFIQTARLSRMVNALSLDNIKLPSEGFKKQDYVWLQTCCFGATVGGYSDAPLTPSSPSAASPSLVPWSHTVRLVCSQSCSPGIDGKRQCEKRGVWSSVSLRGMLMELSCHVGADVSRRKGSMYNIQNQSKSTPAVVVWWLQGTTWTYEHLLWPRWGDLSKLICFHLILVWFPFCYRTSFSLKKPHITSMLLIGFWSSGTAWAGSDVTHGQTYTQNPQANLNQFC